MPQKSKSNIPNPKKFTNSIKKVYLKPKVVKAFGNSASPVKQIRSSSMGPNSNHDVAVQELKFCATEVSLK